jgi:hypothetical protein
MIVDPHCTVLNWNVRGLNNPAHRQVVKDLVADNACSVICIQETKLSSVDDALISVSDHCPMILSCSPTSRRYKGFRFESYWLQMPEFKEIVAQSWVRPVSASNKVRALHIKLSRLAKALKKWHRQRMAESRREEKQAQELVLRLDQTQDQLQLTETEFLACKEVKGKILALAAIRKIRIRQRSRLTWICAGDVKDRRWRPEGGEWEPIKIPHRTLAYVPKSTGNPSHLTRSRPPSYRQAIGLRN